MTSRWSVGGCHEEIGEFHFLPLQSDPYEKHWHCDSDGNKTYTMLKKNNPLMEGFREWELHGPREVATSSGEKTLEPPSLEGSVMSLAGYQIADVKVHQACSARGHPETMNDP